MIEEIVKDSVAVDLREANTVGIGDVLVKHGVIERTEGCEDGVVEHNRKVRLVSCAFTSSNSMEQTRKSAEEGGETSEDSDEKNDQISGRG